MTLLAVTVIGDDRPGIVAAVTDVLARPEVGGNLEDASMTILRGHFAMTLIVATPRPVSEVETALQPICAAYEVVVAVRPVSESPAPVAAGVPHVVVLHGADRPGLVSAVAGAVARHGGNITDLTTRLSGELYVLTMEVDLPEAAARGVSDELAAWAEGSGVHVTVRPADADLL